MNMAAIAKHAADVAGTPLQRLTWNAVWLTELATELPQLTGSLVLDAAQPHDSYYKFHLNYLNLFDLIRTERNPLVRSQERVALSSMDATTGDDVNALYDAFVYALTGDMARLSSGVAEERQWLDYKARLDAQSGRTRNSQNCGNPAKPGHFACVPASSTQVTQPLPGLPPLVQSIGGSAGETLRALLPLPVVDRRGADFLWQKDPTLLDGDEPPTWEPPGDDFLLPYWMMRYYSEASPPRHDPLPVWLGPTFQ
jgi:hypothetical protein